MKLKNEQIVGIAGLLGIAYYVFFCNKEGASAGADTSGGGGGGGGFGGGGFAPASLVVLNTPPATTATASPVGIQPMTVNPTIASALGAGKPVAASTSSSDPVVVAQSSGVSTGGGIVPVSEGGSAAPLPYSTGTVSAADMKTGLSGGTVFKPFSGKGVLTLDNLLM